MVLRNSVLVFLVYETRGVMFSETTPPCFLSELNYRSAVFKVHQQLIKEKNYVVPITNLPYICYNFEWSETKWIKSKSIRSLVFFFFWTRVKKNELNPSCKCTSLFSDRKTWRWYSAPSSGNVRSKDEHRDRHVVF